MANPIWPVYGKQNVDAVNARSISQSLGKDDFMKILIAQMSNQDPTQPLQDRELITQMAQFSSVEQLMNMANVMQAMRQSIGISGDLIGKVVTWTESDGRETTLLQGTVTAISFKDGLQLIEVGDAQIPLEDIVRIEQQKEEAP